MATGDDKLVRVRGGGLKGVRLITLGEWKEERAAGRGKAKKVADRGRTRMEAKMRRRVQKRAKVKAKPANKRGRHERI